jgi:hypothetical protein
MTKCGNNNSKRKGLEEVREHALKEKRKIQRYIK